MPNGTGGGGSVAQTTAVALPVGAGLIVLQYLVHPSWPPPDDILTIVATACAPAAHLIGRAIYRKLTNWAGDEPAQPGELVAIPPGAPAVQVAQVPEPAPVPQVLPAQPPVVGAPAPAVPPPVGGAVLNALHE